jgi:hypothetical protein
MAGVRTPSQRLVAAIAQGLARSQLAAAKEDFLAFRCFEFYRSEVGALVAAIAKGLFLAFAASAPEIGFPGLNLDRIGGLLGDMGCAGHTLFLPLR